MNRILLPLLLIGLLSSCQQLKPAYKLTPNERIEQHIAELKNELTGAEHGWKMIYFPRTDSLLFTSPKQKTNRSDAHYQSRVMNEGFGGHAYHVYFNADGTLRMAADFDSSTIRNYQSSHYALTQNSSIQLSFISYNYLHRNVNERFRARDHFQYLDRDTLGNLLFSTYKYSHPAKEYIMLSKVPDAEDAKNFLSQSLKHREAFEQMKNPQIVIRQGSRIYFRSDVFLKSDFVNNQPYVGACRGNRFYVFEYNATPEELSVKRSKSQFIGSGYVGTDEGLSFHSGLRYNSDIIFYDFVYSNGQFVARHYDYTNRRFTGFVAEISDKPIIVD